MGLPADRQLRVVAELAARQLQLQAEILALTEQVALKSAELRKVAEEELPSAMTEAGIREFALQDGSKLSVKPFYSVNISEENRPKAFAWLRKHGFGDLIKNTYAVAFGKGEDKKAQKLLAAFKKMKLNYDAKESVHPSTLKAWAREQVEAGKPPPEKVFGLYVGEKAEIKVPKEDK